MRELNDTSDQRRKELGRALAGVEANIKAVKLLLGTPSRALRAHLAELEAARTRAEADLAAVAPPPLELHPNAAETYRKTVADLTGLIAAGVRSILVGARAKRTVLSFIQIARLRGHPYGHRTLL